MDRATCLEQLENLAFSIGNRISYFVIKIASDEWFNAIDDNRI